MRQLTIAKREPKRQRVFLNAVVDAGTRQFDARICDISRTGALLKSDSVPATGSEVRLICGDTHVAARVAWAEENHFGLEFTTPLLLGKLVDQDGAKLRVSAPRAYGSSDFDLLG